MNRAATSALTHDLCLIMLQMFRFLSWMSFPPSYFVGDKKKKKKAIKHKNVIITHQLSRSVKGSCQLMHSRLFFFWHLHHSRATDDLLQPTAARVMSKTKPADPWLQAVMWNFTQTTESHAALLQTGGTFCLRSASHAHVMSPLAWAGGLTTVTGAGRRPSKPWYLI